MRSQFGGRAPQLPAEHQRHKVFDVALKAMAAEVDGFYSSYLLLVWLQKCKSEQLPSFTRLEDESKISAPTTDWQLMAFRDAALRVRDFEVAMHGANKAAKELGFGLNWATSPFVILDRKFPKRLDARNAQAHSTERYNSADQMIRHSTDDDIDIPGFIRVRNSRNTTIANGISNDTWHATFNGKLVFVQINFNKVRELNEVKSVFFDAVERSLYTD